MHLVFAHATKDSKAPEMSYDGKIVLVNDGELHPGTRADDGTYSTANLHERWAARMPTPTRCSKPHVDRRRVDHRVWLQVDHRLQRRQVDGYNVTS